MSGSEQNKPKEQTLCGMSLAILFYYSIGLALIGLPLVFIFSTLTPPLGHFMTQTLGMDPMVSMGVLALLIHLWAAASAILILKLILHCIQKEPQSSETSRSCNG